VVPRTIAELSANIFPLNVLLLLSDNEIEN
jgi:hypothetical protein